MKFKILAGTETHNKLKALRAKIDDCNRQAEEIGDELGAEGVYRTRGLAGGIDGMQFLGNVPENFRSMGRKYDNIYMPKSVHKELHDRLNALPRVKEEELNEIVGFHYQWIGLRCLERPGWDHGNDFDLIDTGDGSTCNPTPDMIEILGSEFDQLTKQLKAEREKEKV